MDVTWSLSSSVEGRKEIPIANTTQGKEKERLLLERVITGQFNFFQLFKKETNKTNAVGETVPTWCLIAPNEEPEFAMGVGEGPFTVYRITVCFFLCNGL